MSMRRRWIGALGLMLAGAVLGPALLLGLAYAYHVWDRDEDELRGLSGQARMIEYDRMRFLRDCGTASVPWRAQRASLEARLPTDLHFQELLEDWDAKATALGVSLSLNDVEKSERGAHREARISVTVEGSGAALERLLRTIDEGPRAVSWQTLSWDVDAGPRRRLRARIDVYASKPDRAYSLDHCDERPRQRSRFHLPFFASRWHAREEKFALACASIHEVQVSPEDLACYEDSTAVAMMQGTLEGIDRARKWLPDLSPVASSQLPQPSAF
jgi:hypothetical protein